MTRSVVVRGLDLNDGDRWVTSEVSMWGLPAPVYTLGQRAQLDGVWMTDPYSGAMSGGISGHYIGGSPEDAQGALRLLRKTLRNGDCWLSVRTVAGWQSIVMRRSGELKISFTNDAKVFKWETQLTASDPVWFRGGQGPDGQLDSSGYARHELRLHKVSGGLVFPWVFPLRWATTTTQGEATVYVPYAARLVAEISGPVVSPSLLFTGASRSYILTWDDLTLGYGEKLVVDPLRRSALLGGDVPAIPSIREWPESLSDGYWTVRYSAAEYNQTSTAVITIKELV